MIHPFQTVLLNRDGTLLFCVIKNEILAFKKTENGYSLCGRWIDGLDTTPLIKEKVIKEQARQLSENASKKLKTNEGDSVAQPRKEAKVPTPGPGAPPVYQFIRNLALSRNEELLIGCTDSDKAAVIFSIDLTSDSNILHLIKRQPYPKRPNAITTSINDKDLILADKFGDIYAMPIADDVLSSINNERAPILGHVSMLTDVAISKGPDGKQYIFTADRDEHIKISHYPQSFIVDKWLFGHQEFVSTLCLPEWSKELLFSAGGDPNIFSWNWISGKLLDRFDYSDLIQKYLTSEHLAPKRFQNEAGNVIEFGVVKIVTLATEPYLAFFVEATRVLFILKVDSKTGLLSLHQTINLECNVVSLTSATDKNIFCVSLDTRNNEDTDIVKFISLQDSLFAELNNQHLALTKSITDSLKRDEISNVEIDEVYPLYHISSLRKHGEHFS